MLGRPLLFVGFIVMLITAVFLICMTIHYTEGSNATPQTVGKCYNECVTKGIKRLEVTASNCVSRINKKQRIDAQCMRRVFSVVHDSCYSHCKNATRGVVW